MSANNNYMKVWPAVAVCGLVVCGTASAADSPKYRAPDHVLAIGVGEYERLNDIPSAAGGPKRIAGVWPGTKSTQIVNAKATAAAIKDAFEKLKTEVKEGGFTVVVLSGHGGRDAGAWTFCPHDYDPARPNQTQIHGGWIAGKVGELVGRGDRVLLIVDSCHAGEIRSHMEHLLGAEAGKGEVILLASSVPAQLSIGRDGGGLFSTAIAEALCGRADVDADRHVTLKEVRRYVGWRLRELVRAGTSPPGVAWKEQDAVIDSSAAVNDLQPLSVAREKKAERNLKGLRLDADDRIGKTGGLYLPDLDGWADKLAKPLPPDRLGAWRAVREFEVSAGRPADGSRQEIKKRCRDTLILLMGKDGEYMVEYRRELQSEVGGQFRVLFRQAGTGTFRYLEEDDKKVLVLDYGNGASGLAVEGWDKAELKLKADPHTFTHPWPNGVWVFRRGE